MKYYCWDCSDKWGAKFWFISESESEDRCNLHIESMVVLNSGRIMSKGKDITQEEFHWRLEHPDEVYMQECL